MQMEINFTSTMDHSYPDQHENQQRAQLESHQKEPEKSDEYKDEGCSYEVQVAEEERKSGCNKCKVDKELEEGDAR